jgi:hypothetical protein
MEEVLIDVGEIGGAGGEVDCVGRPGEIADDELVLGKSLVEEGLEVAEKLGALEERVADQGDVVAGIQLQRKVRRNRRGCGGTGGGLLVDAVLGKFGMLGLLGFGSLGGGARRGFGLPFLFRLLLTPAHPEDSKNHTEGQRNANAPGWAYHVSVSEREDCMYRSRSTPAELAPGDFPLAARIGDATQSEIHAEARRRGAKELKISHSSRLRASACNLNQKWR